MLAVLLGGLSMVSPFSIDTFFPAFHAMERALQVNAAQLQQVITAYMVPFAFASLVHGPLSDALGRRPVMIWGMALYTVGSVACTVAPNYESLIAARILHGELGLELKATLRFSMALSEACQNIVEHAGTSGWVAVQAYTFRRRLGRRVVVIAVSDCPSPSCSSREMSRSVSSRSCICRSVSSKRSASWRRTVSKRPTFASATAT